MNELAEFIDKEGLPTHCSMGMDTSTGAWRAKCRCGWLSLPCGEASEPRGGPSQAFQLLRKRHLDPINEEIEKRRCISRGDDEGGR